MQLFAASGNSAVEGIDTTNACYGGTQAFQRQTSYMYCNCSFFKTFNTAEILMFLQRRL